MYEHATHEVRFTFDQLGLIHKSLQAVRALGVLPPQDELLDDTIRVVDQALDAAVRRHIPVHPGNGRSAPS
jgi:hypothetical protein